MTTPGKRHAAGFPVFSVVFTPSPERVLVGGGGGATKAGVKNAVVRAQPAAAASRRAPRALPHAPPPPVPAQILYDVVPTELELSVVSEYLLAKDDDGCMHIAIHPKEKSLVAAVNSPEAAIAAGNNRNCRVFLIQKSRLRFVQGVKTTDSVDATNYQKSARFSPDGKLLCTGTTDGRFSMWSWPDMAPAFPPLELGSEIMDIQFDPAVSSVGLVTPGVLRLIDTEKAKVRWELAKQVVGTENCDFRALRFGIKSTQGILFVVLNARSRKAAFIQKYSVKDKKLISSKSVSLKPITAFSLSADGSTMAFGSSDLSLNVLNAKTLTRIARFQNAHDFPSTALDINSTNTVVVSGSADGTLFVASVPPIANDSTAGSYTTVWLLVVAVLLIVLLILVGMADSSGGEL
ncbi:hypothetical protein HK105_204527 [Polyrhizophydium stewartii]|uniref:Uncharacterized protein n=1 Tax=Polyrhizophydium stewartii TaxID=2732419 RepID=A0ABR4N8N0_9FUNG